MGKWVFEKILLPLVALYVAFSLIPAETLWFEPGEVRFLDTPSNTVPILEYQREIKIPTMIAYSVVVRQATENGPGDVACEGDQPGYTYFPQNGPVVGKNLAWWVPQDFRCRVLPDGAYWARTCWTLVNPLGDLIGAYTPWRPLRFLGPLAPTKRVCRDSGVFHVGPLPAAY